MSKKRYIVRLSKKEREDLFALIRRGKHRVSAIKRRHARVLLKVDQGKHGPSWSDVRTGEALEIQPGPRTRIITDRRPGTRWLHIRRTGGAQGGPGHASDGV